MTAADVAQPSLEDEPRLIARCRQGEAAAWDELFDRHYDAAGRFVFQMMPSLTREDVQEICQETFLAVVRHLAAFNGQSRIQTWIFRVAANKARDFVERQHAAKRGGGQAPLSLQAEDPETGQVLDPPSSSPGPEAHLLAAEQVVALRAALDQLESPCRMIIELRYFGDLSYEEIGRSLSLNLKTVSSRLSRCLDKLESITRTLMAEENSAPSSV